MGQGDVRAVDDVSIHASVWEATRAPQLIDVGLGVSIHASVWEATLAVLVAW